MPPVDLIALPTTALQSQSMSQQVHDLYKDHHRWLFSWLRKRLDCAYQAEDLSHDTFIRLLKNNQIVSLSEPRAFLTTVAKRVLSNHWRRQSLEQSYLETLAALPECWVISEEEKALLFETLNGIDQLLDGLPIPVRKAFLYSQLDGLSQTEIAQKLHISISTVKRYLVKASAQCYFALSIDEACR